MLLWAIWRDIKSDADMWPLIEEAGLEEACWDSLASALWRLQNPLLAATLPQFGFTQRLMGAPCDLHLPPWTATLVQPPSSHFLRGGLCEVSIIISWCR